MSTIDAELSRQAANLLPQHAASRIPGFRVPLAVSVRPDSQDEESERGGIPFGAGSEKVRSRRT
jgi:hypothetical protein